MQLYRDKWGIFPFTPTTQKFIIMERCSRTREKNK